MKYDGKKRPFDCIFYEKEIYENSCLEQASSSHARLSKKTPPGKAMSSRELVEDFLIRNAWHLVRPLDLGTTSHIFVIEKDNARQVLKIRMDGDARILKAEYRMLQYLNTTKMQQDVPKVGGGLPELEGFLMEELRYPFQSERNSQAWMLNLVQALRTRTQCLC